MQLTMPRFDKSQVLVIGDVQDWLARGRELPTDELLVFREFVEFKPLAEHPASRMPLIKEYRFFYLNSALIDIVRYWDIDGYQDDDMPPTDLFADVAKHVKSRFFTMDVAQRPDGEWMIIELGDAQVAGLPQSTNVDIIYRALSGIH